MSKKISNTKKRRIRDRMDTCMQQAEQAIFTMITLTSDSSDKHKSLKLKQTLLSLRVEYNRLRLKYEDD